MRFFSIDIALRQEFDEALQTIKDDMKTEGFGVLSEIDVRATLIEKIGIDIGPYTILWVCNPALAARAIAIEPKVGVFLPCTVLVRGVGTSVQVSAQDPMLMEEILGDEALEPVAKEARDRIAKVLGKLASTADA